MKIRFALTSMLLFALILSCTYAWWNYDWHYRDRYDITLPTNTMADSVCGALAYVYMDTQSLIQSGKLNPDCSDIRVVYDDTVLEHYTENCGSTNTKIYFRLPCVKTNANISVYVYYGNPDAVDVSNISVLSPIINKGPVFWFPYGVARCLGFNDTIICVYPSDIYYHLRYWLRISAVKYNITSGTIEVINVTRGYCTSATACGFNEIACGKASENAIKCLFHEEDENAFNYFKVYIIYLNNMTADEIYHLRVDDLFPVNIKFPNMGDYIRFGNSDYFLGGGHIVKFNSTGVYYVGTIGGRCRKLSDTKALCIDRDYVYIFNSTDDKVYQVGNVKWKHLVSYSTRYNQEFESHYTHVGCTWISNSTLFCPMKRFIAIVYQEKDGDIILSVVSLNNESYISSAYLDYGIALMDSKNLTIIRPPYLSLLSGQKIGSEYCKDLYYNEKIGICINDKGEAFLYTLGGLSSITYSFPNFACRLSRSFVPSMSKFNMYCVSRHRYAWPPYANTPAYFIRVSISDSHFFGEYAKVSDAVVKYKSDMVCNSEPFPDVDTRICGHYYYYDADTYWYSIYTLNATSGSTTGIGSISIKATFSIASVNGEAYAFQRGGIRIYKVYPTIEERNNSTYTFGQISCVGWTDGYIYCFGGDNGEIYRYDPISDSVTLLPQTLPNSTNNIECFLNNSYNPYNIICYDFANGAIYTFTPDQGASIYDSGLPTRGSNRNAGLTADGRFLLFSGSTSILVYDFSKKKVFYPYVRYEGMACTGDGEKIYCVGGRYGDLYNNYVLIFHRSFFEDYPANSFAYNLFEFKPLYDLPVNITNSSCIYLNDILYCFGGEVNDVESNIIIKVNISSGETQISYALPVNVRNLKCHSYGNNILCYGGYTEASENSLLFLYDTQTDTIAYSIDTILYNGNCYVDPYDNLLKCISDRYGQIMYMNVSSGDIEVPYKTTVSQTSYRIVLVDNFSVVSIGNSVESFSSLALYEPNSYYYVSTEAVLPPYIAATYEQPPSGVVYKQGATYTFIATVCDDNSNLPDYNDIQQVIFEINGVNYTLTDYSAIVNATCANYSIQFVDLQAGTYYIKWYATDGIYWDSAAITYVIDPNDAPWFQNIGNLPEEYPYNPFVYEEFNATICDIDNNLPTYEDIEWVKFEINGVNYTVTYNETVSSTCEIFRIWFNLTAGDYYYRWYVYDGSNLVASDLAHTYVYPTHPPWIEQVTEPYDPMTQKVNYPYTFSVVICDPDTDYSAGKVDTKCATLVFDNILYTTCSYSYWNNTCVEFEISLYNLTIATHSYFWNVTDGIYTEQSSTYTYTVLENHPQYIAATYKPPEGEVYKPDKYYTFQADICDPDSNLPDYNDVDIVKFIIDGVEYTSLVRLLLNSTCYRYSITLQGLSAGTHTIEWYAYDHNPDYIESHVYDTYTIEPNYPPYYLNLTYPGERVPFTPANYTFSIVFCDPNNDLPYYYDLRYVKFYWENNITDVTSNYTIINETCAYYEVNVSVEMAGTYPFRWCAYDGVVENCTDWINITFYVPTPAGGGGGGGAGAAEIVFTVVQPEGMRLPVWYCLKIGCTPVKFTDGEANFTLAPGDLFKGATLVVEYEGENRTYDLGKIWKENKYSTWVIIYLEKLLELSSLLRIGTIETLQYILAAVLMGIAYRRFRKVFSKSR